MSDLQRKLEMTLSALYTARATITRQDEMIIDLVAAGRKTINETATLEVFTKYNIPKTEIHFMKNGSVVGKIINLEEV